MADYLFQETIPEARKPEMIEVFGKGWTAEIEDENGDLIPNPQTKAQYAADFLHKFTKNCWHQRVMRYREDQRAPIDTSMITDQ